MKRLGRIVPLLAMAAAVALLAAPGRASEMVVVLAPDSATVVARAELRVQFAPSGDRKIGAKVESPLGILVWAVCDDDWSRDRATDAARGLASHLDTDPVLDLPRLLESLGLRGCRERP